MLLVPVPHRDLVQVVLDGQPGLLAELHTDTRNVVLTLARMLVTVQTGRIVPKTEAADRILPRLPSGRRDVLALARAVHAGEHEALPTEIPGLEDFATHVAAAIRAEAGDGQSSYRSPPATTATPESRRWRKTASTPIPPLAT